MNIFLIRDQHSRITPESGSSPGQGALENPGPRFLAGKVSKDVIGMACLPWQFGNRPLDLGRGCFATREGVPGVLVRFLKPGETTWYKSIERLIGQLIGPREALPNVNDC